MFILKRSRQVQIQFGNLPGGSQMDSFILATEAQNIPPQNPKLLPQIPTMVMVSFSLFWSGWGINVQFFSTIPGGKRTGPGTNISI